MLKPPTAQPDGHTANGRGTPTQPEANGHHGRAEREDGKSTPGASGKERPLAPTLREPKPALYDELG
jgi:hypothetical protein